MIGSLASSAVPWMLVLALYVEVGRLLFHAGRRDPELASDFEAFDRPAQSRIDGAARAVALLTWVVGWPIWLIVGRIVARGAKR